MIETRQFFNSELCRFREKMCSTQYWQDGNPKPCLDKCFQVLHMLHVNVQGTPEDKERVADAFLALASEYTRRRTLMALLPLRKAVGLPN